mmetsp:Transcript_32109/g.63923  ORF Transcript_32109/g.63923 Transcript_32109/m.63923 type:complete len:229 (-) Transcript_32109:102-788(-)
MTIQAQADPEIAIAHGLGAAPRIPSNDCSPVPSAPSESKLPAATANATFLATEEEMVPPESPHDDEIHNEQQSDHASNNFHNNNINGNSRSWPNTRSGKWMMYAMITISFVACLIPSVMYASSLHSTEFQHQTFPPVPAPVYVRSTRRPSPNFDLLSRRPAMWRPSLPVSTQPTVSLPPTPRPTRQRVSRPRPTWPTPSSRPIPPTLFPTYGTWTNPPTEGGSLWWLH